MKFNFALMCQDEIKSLTVQIEQLRNEPTITVNPYFESNKQIRIDSLMKSRQIWERVLEIYRISEEPSTMLFHNWIVFTNDEKYFTVAKITNQFLFVYCFQNKD